MFKTLEYNFEYIKNIPKEILDELINLNDVIPDNITRQLSRNIPIFEEKRSNYIYNNSNLMGEYQYNRARIKSSDDYNIIQKENFNFALEFLDKYPQFKKIVKGIKYYNESLKVVRFEELK